ncbi:alkaline phosphatase family protein [Pseudoxanthomonas sp. SGD-10]|nr:alkaline phosphatase family protein [Pseudoxanthomonas sp. SGD-10]
MYFSNLRLSEYLILLYRLILCFVFYQIARILFFAFNSSIFQLESLWFLLKLCWHGIAFDSTAILYVNSLFILLSIFPLTINTKPGYQKLLTIVYFASNLLIYATNFIDFLYYKFSQTRSTLATLDVVKNEENAGSLFWHFFTSYWYVLVIFIVISSLWILVYQKAEVKEAKIENTLTYFSFSIVGILITAFLIVGGIRGGYSHSTRPINMVDAYRHVKVPNHGDIVLNTPFSILRTLKVKEFKTPDWVSNEYIKEHIKPIKNYQSVGTKEKPNIVIFILESFGREYWGSMNKTRNIKDFKSYTPFLDSLSQQSLIFTNAYANGRQSIHGMSSILAGIPSFQHAFTSSPYAKQNIQSIVSISDSLGYKTSFFHGAANGSMGFLGFSNILGYHKYYGRSEFNNEDEYDGIWGIWDEPFLQYMQSTITKESQPFMTTVFTLTSHDPFKVPAKYQDKFKEGNLPIHKCVEYTDYAIRKFFEQAKNQAWYENTIFVFTADHTSQNYYQAYNNSIERFAIPIMFFSPNKGYNLKGVREDLAQQIDIYPTLVELMGYKKPFRSWGRSLLSNRPDEEPRVINSPGNVYQFMQGNYIYIFDGLSFTGIFDIQDKLLSKNLIGETNEEIEKGKQDCKAFIQDYMFRISKKKLNEDKYSIGF